MGGRLLIAGAGIAGATLARTLARRAPGLEVALWDAGNPASPSSPFWGGLTLTPNAISVLSKVDAWPLPGADGAPSESPIVCPVAGFCAYDRKGVRLMGLANEKEPYGSVMHTADRHALVQALLDDAVHVESNRGVADVREDPSTGGVIVTDRDGAEEAFTAVVGADGLWSRVLTSEAMGLDAETTTPVPLGLTTVRGIYEGSDALVEAAGGTALAMGPGVSWFARAMPGQPSRVQWALTYTCSEDAPAPAVDQDLHDRVQATAARAFAIPALHGMLAATAPSQMVAHVLYDRPELPRWHNDAQNVVVMGDAAHPMSPFQGQGANMAIEDAGVLGTAIGMALNGDVAAPFAVYEGLRKARTTALVGRSRGAALTSHVRGSMGSWMRNRMLGMTGWLMDKAQERGGKQHVIDDYLYDIDALEYQTP